MKFDLMKKPLQTKKPKKLIGKSSQKKAPPKKRGPKKKEYLDYNTVQQLLQVFRIDWTVEEACAFASISKSSYYSRIAQKKKFLDKNDPNSERDFEEAIEQEKELFLVTARKTVYKAIQNGDVKVAMEVLSKKDLRYKSQATWTKDDPIHTKNSVTTYQIPDNGRNTSN